MKKQTIIVLVAIVATAVGTYVLLSVTNLNRDSRRFADDRNFRVDRDRGYYFDEFLEDGNAVSLSGKLVLENNEFPKINSNGKEYELIAPLDQLLNLELTNGASIKIEGVEQDSNSIILISIDINGKVSEINHDDRNGFMGGNNSGSGRGNNSKGRSRR